MIGSRSKSTTPPDAPDLRILSHLVHIFHTSAYKLSQSGLTRRDRVGFGRWRRRTLNQINLISRYTSRRSFCYPFRNEFKSTNALTRGSAHDVRSSYESASTQIARCRWHIARNEGGIRIEGRGLGLLLLRLLIGGRGSGVCSWGVGCEALVLRRRRRDIKSKHIDIYA